MIWQHNNSINFKLKLRDSSKTNIDCYSKKHKQQTSSKLLDVTKRHIKYTAKFNQNWTANNRHLSLTSPICFAENITSKKKFKKNIDNFTNFIESNDQIMKISHVWL